MAVMQAPDEVLQDDDKNFNDFEGALHKMSSTTYDTQISNNVMLLHFTMRVTNQTQDKQTG